jgi:hypothetical protein
MRSLPVVLAFIWSCVVAAGLYGALRGIQFVFFPDPNPATIVWSAHAGYFWRAWCVAYAGGAAGFVAYILARRDAARVARALLPALTVAAAVLATQAALLP